VRFTKVNIFRSDPNCGKHGAVKDKLILLAAIQSFLVTTRPRKIDSYSCLEAEETAIRMRKKAVGHRSERANVTFCYFDPLEARCKHSSLHNSFSFLLRFARITYRHCCVVVDISTVAVRQHMALSGTEYRGQVVSSPASYSGGPKSKTWPEDYYSD
jgi:hypothetical protein